MLHHVSFSVRDPARAAALAAGLLAGSAVKAPCPPFPAGSWFVVLGDAHGSLIELTPWGTVFDPEGRGGVAMDPDMRSKTASHVLAGTPLSTEAVLALAEREGLRAAPVDTGLFRFVKVWVAEGLLLELLPPEHQEDYIACFGARGAGVLDSRLRNLEQTVSALLAAAAP